MFNGSDTYGLLRRGDRLLAGACHLHTLIFMSAAQSRGEASPGSLRHAATVAVAVVVVGGGKGGKVTAREFILVKRARH